MGNDRTDQASSKSQTGSSGPSKTNPPTQVNVKTAQLQSTTPPGANIEAGKEQTAAEVMQVLQGKQPGWRQPSGKQTKVASPLIQRTSSRDSLRIEHIESTTSISSNGPLKEFIKDPTAPKGHKVKFEFVPSKEFLREITKLEDDDDKFEMLVQSKIKGGQTGSNSKISMKTCAKISPLDAAGGFKYQDLTHVKVVAVHTDDDDPNFNFEKSSRSSKTTRTGGKSPAGEAGYPKTLPMELTKEQPKSAAKVNSNVGKSRSKELNKELPKSKG